MISSEAGRALLQRKRNILYLISHYLHDNGFTATTATLVDEARLDNQFVVCDNVDLDTIYLEFCAFYHLKFGRHPKIVRRTADTEMATRNNAPPVHKTGKTKAATNNNAYSFESLLNCSALRPITSTEECRLKITPFPEMHGLSDEWQNIAKCVCRDIIEKDLRVLWTDIHGVEHAKEILRESVLLPLEYPELFTGTVKPWGSVLLHGPPGTGKTLIAKAICSETHGKIMFLSINSSTVTSKWRGESEKYIRIVFEVAKFYAPSIIFFDEIESFTSKRDSCHEHEASKRFKNELLTLIDGINDDCANIFILANTNMPWEIDPAFMRRFERKIFVGLPPTEARIEIIRTLLPAASEWSPEIMNNFGALTEGFTGDEIRIVCKETSMMQIRKAVGTAKKQKSKIQCVLIATVDDFKISLNRVKANSKPQLQKHLNWNRDNVSEFNLDDTYFN